MVQVAPIKLKVGPKVLWFDPAGVDVKADDHVIVSTDRGHEYGIATSDVIDVSEDLVAGFKSPLKPVLRIATPEDEEMLTELERRGEEALVVFRRLAEETHTDMHPVSVEFLFDGDKAVFFFESEERVDFRELVRRLAAEFHVRVDMRQIGVRDAARMIGGLGHCGQELCCRRLGGDFNPVTIRMAKEQGLSLNPQKISGCCGRLMCCLRYEFDTYKEFNSRAPKMNAKVEVPGGIAKVTDVSMPTESIALRLEDGKTVRIPLSEFEEPEEGRRPHVISEEVFERYTQDDSLEKLSGNLFGDVIGFTGEEKLADPSKRSHGKASKRDDRSDRSRSSKSSSRKPRRRASEGGSRKEGSAENPSSKASQDMRSNRRERGLEGDSRRSRRSRGSSERQSSGAQTQSTRQASSHRKRRRRPAAEGSASQPSSANRGDQAQASSSRSQKPTPRPGHRSSGLRNADVASSSGGQRKQNQRHGQRGENGQAKTSTREAGSGPKGQTKGGNAQPTRRPSEHRKPRRRKNPQEGSSNATE